MRAFIKVIVLMMVCFAVGCTPEEEPNGGGNNNNNEPQSFTVSLLASPANGGTVSGGGTFEEGQTCTAKAIPSDGFTFIHWTENDSLVSSDADYAFAVTGNHHLVAHFASNGGGPKYFTINVFADPIEYGSSSGGGRYQEGLSCTVTAFPEFVYAFSNWTENGNVVSEDLSYTFTVTGNRNLVANFVFNTSVDMGLPSGTLWAACNLGANTPEEYGGYFAWGETETKNKYGCENYWHCHGCEYNGNAHLITLTKYCGDPDLGYNGFTDDLTVLLPDDDAATVQLGDNWRMPTQEEWEELLNNTTGSFYTTDNGICGVLLTATNGAKLFLPAAGFYSEGLWYAGSLGNYWSSCLDKLEPDGAWGFAFTSDGGHMSTSFRFCGRSVRAVM